MRFSSLSHEADVLSIFLGESWCQKVFSIFGFGRPESHLTHLKSLDQLYYFIYHQWTHQTSPLTPCDPLTSCLTPWDPLDAPIN